MTTPWAVTTVSNLLMDVPTAAEYVGVTRDDLQVAVNTHQVHAITTHPRRPGVPLVRMRDVEAWLLVWPRLAS